MIRPLKIPHLSARGLRLNSLTWSFLPDVLTGIDRTTIVKLEKLQRDPSLDVMIILIKVLKLDFNILDLINSFPYDLSGGKKDDS